MTRSTIRLSVVTAIAIALCAPAARAATSGTVVPPENSAASQYTEAVPTAGGDAEAGGGGKGGHRTPANVLGANKAHKLESQGKQGREAAEVAAATAPEASPVPQEAPQPEPKPAPAPTGGASHPAKGAAPAHHRHASDRQAPAPEPARPSTAPRATPDGASGLGEVLAAATGSSSSGQLGALLPLAILAAIAWALVYLWRQRQKGRLT